MSASQAPDPPFFRVWTSVELPEGEGRQVVAGGTSLALFRFRGRVYALDGICPHAGSPLGPGVVASGYVECPWHGWRFELATGECVDVKGLRQRCYGVVEADGGIFVQLEEP